MFQITINGAIVHTSTTPSRARVTSHTILQWTRETAQFLANVHGAAAVIPGGDSFEDEIFNPAN